MSLRQDMQNIREGSQEVAKDLQDFLKNNQGKSPQEVLGSMAKSSLFHGILTATCLAAGVLILGSIGPYYYQQYLAQAPAEEAEPAEAAAEKETKQEESTEETKTASTKPPEENPEVSDEDKQKVVKQLGLEETKYASPDENPLENSADDLLNELK